MMLAETFSAMVQCLVSWPNQVKTNTIKKFISVCWNSFRIAMVMYGRNIGAQDIRDFFPQKIRTVGLQFCKSLEAIRLISGDTFIWTRYW